MKKILFLLLFSSVVLASPGPAGNIVQFSNGGIPTNVSLLEPLPVNIGGLGGVNQGLPGLMTAPWWVEGTDGVNHASYTAGDSENVNLTNASVAITAAALPLPAGAATSALQTTGNTSLSSILTAIGSPLQAGGNVAVTNFPASQPVTGTFWQATQPVSGTFWQATQPVSGTFWQATQPISALQLPVSLGAKTTANSMAVNIASDQTVPVSGSFWQATQPVSGTFWQATQPVSATQLPTALGAKTTANSMAVNIASDQTVPTSNTQLPTSLGAKTTANSMAVNIASDQTVPVSGTVTTGAPVNANSSLASTQTVGASETYLVAPAHTVGVIVECESGNSDNLRWGFSNATSNILSTTTGMLCEPGRDTGVLPFGAGNYLHMIAVTTTATAYIDVQWVLSQ